MYDRSAAHFPGFRQSLLLCVPPLLAFTLAGFPLAAWLIDDAAISFAYARNLADGAGFVSQPGKAPVEGFSNPLWTLLFVPGFWLNSDVPVWSAKFLGHLFSFGTFFFGYHIVLRLTRSPLFGFLAMTFLALNTSFVVWNVSGLENALYAFEIAAIAYVCLLTLERPSWRLAATAGLLAAAATLTRPDGVIFALLWPWALFVLSVRDWKLTGETFRSCLVYGVTAALPVIAYKGFTFFYFGSLFPNTYYAKGGPSLETVVEIVSLDAAMVAKAIDLLDGPFGFAWLALGLFVVALVVSLRAKQAVAPLIFLTGAVGLAFLTFMLLPTDWMSEFRFGTPFLVLFYPTLFALIWIAGASLPRMGTLSRRFPTLLVIAILAVASILVHQFRLIRFYAAPTAPLASVSQLYGERFNRAAEILGIENAVYLNRNLGGTLFDSDMEIVDLAGLADATIARTLNKDYPALYDYIFNRVKPHFISTFTDGAFAANLDGSPLFRQQYIPLRESVDPIATDLAGRTMYSGDYVRRDLVENRPEALAQVRAHLYGSR